MCIRDSHYGDTEAEQKQHLLLKSIAPLGSVSTFTYDAFGNPLTSQVQNCLLYTSQEKHRQHRLFVLPQRIPCRLKPRHELFRLPIPLFQHINFRNSMQEMCIRDRV